MKRILLISFFILIAASIYAQEFVATVNNNEVGENERFQVSFKFSGESLKKLSNYDPPSFNNFQILSGPNQSTSMQIINGDMSASISYSYILIPTASGSFSIGSAKIDYEGETYSTKPIKINVVKGTSAPKENNDTEVSNKEIAENLFIRAFADKKQVYLGEQVTVTYKLYTRLSIAAQMSVNKLPKYQGFWAEEIETSNNITFNTEVINGKQFRVGVLKRVALFPSQTGELEITPFELTVPIQLKRERNPNNLFDSFFGDPFGRGKTIEFDARSNVLKLNVKKLPEENKPDSFKGAVGDYSFTTSMDSTVTQTNQPVTLTLKISGKGNIKLVEFPEFELPTGFEKYDPKIDEDIVRRGDVSGVKTAEYLLVPRVAGKRTIDPIEFSFFNPITERYTTLRSSTFNINIKQGSESSDDYYAKENVDLLDEDIRFIKTSSDDLNKKGELLLFQPIFLFAMVLTLFLFIGAVSYKRKQDKLAGDVRTLRYRKAEKVAKKRFRFAKKLMQDSKSSEFYYEISLALFGYLEDKFSIPKADFTLQKAVEELRKNNVDENIIDEMIKLAEQCEFIRFAPDGEDKTSMQQMYDDLSRIVIEIEKSIN